jgi:uncharacterized protein YhaN
VISGLFKRIASSRIGLKQPDLYLSWAKFEDSSGNEVKAKKILEAGIHSNLDHKQLLNDALAKLDSNSKENERLFKKNETFHSRKPLQEKPKKLEQTKIKREDENNNSPTDGEKTASFKLPLSR